MPKVGVIMRTKDRPVLLQRALASVAGQAFEDWELVVVNDGGDPDPVRQLIDQMPTVARAKVRLISHERSRGMEAASNAGLEALSSEYVLIHDDDDSLHPQFLARTVAYLENPPHPTVKGVVTGTDRIFEVIRGNAVQEVRRQPYNDWLRNISLRRMLAENVYAPIAFLFCREACLEAGKFREDLPVLGDWDFNIRFLCQFEIGYISEKLAYYHDREGDSGAAYASSVKAKADLHAFYDNLLRNEWLRKDIASGRAGVGLLANKALMLWDLGWDIRQAITPWPVKKPKRRFHFFRS